MTPPDYAHCLTKLQVAEALSVTTKTVEQWVKDGRLEQLRWRPPTGGPERVVYLPEDVERIASERRQGPPRPFLVPSQGLQSNGNGHAESTALKIASPSTPSILVAALTEFAAALRALSPEPAATSENSEKLFLTIAEAARYAGLPAADIRRACVSGELPHRKTGRGGYRIHREDLRAFRGKL